jgi:hypothetical protein
VETWGRLEKAIEQNPLHDQKMLDDCLRAYNAGKEDPFKFKLNCPTIKLVSNFDKIEDALIAANRDMYQRDSKIIRPCAIKGKSHDGKEYADSRYRRGLPGPIV